jgi:hypothetical protein
MGWTAIFNLLARGPFSSLGVIFRFALLAGLPEFVSPVSVDGAGV